MINIAILRSAADRVAAWTETHSVTASWQALPHGLCLTAGRAGTRLERTVPWIDLELSRYPANKLENVERKMLEAFQQQAALESRLEQAEERARKAQASLAQEREALRRIARTVSDGDMSQGVRLSIIGEATRHALEGKPDPVRAAASEFIELYDAKMPDHEDVWEAIDRLRDALTGGDAEPDPAVEDGVGADIQP